MRTTEILLVDDNPADTDLTTEVLSRNGCPSRIHSVIYGVEAVAFPPGGKVCPRDSARLRDS
jgi:CheY-like chemotaxis protein